jgi:hypothetical protein
MEIGKKPVVNEIMIHWILNDCTNVTKLLEIYENAESVFLVLEY